MRIKIDLKKSIEQNAADYFEKAKKAKKKREGAERVISELRRKLEEKVKAEREEQKKKIDKVIKREKEWYEKFRWFFASDNTLCIGGRDATTNDILIKKYLEDNDLVCHTDLAGSPFVIIKNGKKSSKEVISEAAQFCACFSKAWKSGLTTASVYCVNAEQVSKEPVKKGAFMIYGKREYFSPKMELAIGDYKGKVMVAPLSAIKKHCKDYFIITQGNEKKSEIAKKVAKAFNLDVDEIIRALPEGCSLRKR